MPHLSATYQSPSNQPSPHTLSQPLPAISSPPSTADRVAYLGALQTSIKSLQGQINTFLTQKMDEDKAAGAAKGDDAKAEEKYGEEEGTEDD